MDCDVVLEVRVVFEVDELCVVVCVVVAGGRSAPPLPKASSVKVVLGVPAGSCAIIASKGYGGKATVNDASGFVATVAYRVPFAKRMSTKAEGLYVPLIVAIPTAA